MIRRENVKLMPQSTKLGHGLPEARISLHKIVIDDSESAKVALGGIVIIRE